MARNRPVIVWTIRQSPSNDPKFHQAEMFGGVGRSIKEELIILMMGWCFRMLGVIRGFSS